MKRLAIALALATIGAAPGLAAAQGAPPSDLSSRAYGGIDFSFLDLDAGSGVDDGATGARLRAGYMFTPIFGVEGHFGIGLTDGSDSLPNGRDVDLEAEHWYGLYARAQIPAWRQLNIYGLVGFTRVSVDFEIQDDQETDFSWGVGADYMLNSRWGVQADYMRLVDKSNVEVKALSIGAKYLF